MERRIKLGQRYRDVAAECRKRASVARSPKTRAEFKTLASRYYEMAEDELRGEPPCLFRCPVTGSRVTGVLVEDTPDDDPGAYVSVTCLSCGQIHLVNLKTGKTIGEQGEH
jgi:hypothetical protein